MCHQLKVFLKTLDGTLGQAGVKRKKGQEGQITAPKGSGIAFRIWKSPTLPQPPKLPCEVLFLAHTFMSTLTVVLQIISWLHAQSQQQKQAFIILFPGSIQTFWPAISRNEKNIIECRKVPTLRTYN